MAVRWLLKENDPLRFHWQARSCDVIPQTEGGFAIVCDEIQTQVAETDTEAEAWDWLGLSPSHMDRDDFEALD